MVSSGTLPLKAEPPLIEIEKLQFRYPESPAPALDGVSFRVERGLLYGLLGPNGSGKTTLLKLLAGILAAPKGALRIAGAPVETRTSRERSRCALVPQDFAFYPRLSVRENLEFFAGVQGYGGSDARERIAETMRQTALESWGDHRADRCSGGLKRRLNIAIGLLGRPELLLLDEPTVGIDPQSRHFILDSVRSINRAGTTVVYTTHYLEEIQSLCARVAVLDRGKLRAEGSLTELLGGGAGAAGALEGLFLELTDSALRD
jgi:ABC-2 type transport system ATP-binding protein